MSPGWWIVCTHFTIQFFATGFFVYSLPLLFEPAIATFETDRTTVNLLPSAASLVGLVVAPLAGPLVDRWSAKALMGLGTAGVILGLLGMSLAPNVLAFVALGALLFGAANVLVGPMTGSAVVSRWFTASRGRALGVAAIGTSAGGILLPNVLALGLESVGWRTTLQGVALATTLIGLPLVLFRFWDRPADLGLEPEPATDAASAAAAASPPVGPDPSSTTGGILAQPRFWLFSLGLSVFLAVYSATVANLGQFGSDRGLAPDQIAALVSGIAIAGIVGKLGFGALADRMPLKLGLYLAIGATLAALGLFSIGTDFPVLALGALCLGLAAGGILPVWNAMVAALFGVANFGRAMGLMSPVISLIVAPAFPLAGAVRDATGSYVPAFQGFGAALVVAVLLLLPLRIERPAP